MLFYAFETSKTGHSWPTEIEHRVVQSLVLPVGARQRARHYGEVLRRRNIFRAINS